MKRNILAIIAVTILLCGNASAQDTFFPIGGFNPPMTTGIMPGADSCGINVMGLMNLSQSQTEARLSEMQAL
jgi:hypothetical protein